MRVGGEREEMKEGRRIVGRGGRGVEERDRREGGVERKETGEREGWRGKRQERAGGGSCAIEGGHGPVRRRRKKTKY